MAPQPGSSTELIWRTVRKIPKGRVATYGEVAYEAGFAGQPRLVGYALHRLPEGSGVPWHRVVNAAGRSSLPGRRQRTLLEREGVRFSRGAIDLDSYGWLKSARRTAERRSR